MSDLESGNWSEVAASNTAAVPDGFPDNVAPSSVKSLSREHFAAIKREWNRSHPTVTSGGSANAQTLTYGVAPTAYVQGQTFSFIAGYSNSGATTLNVNSLGAKSITKRGTTALSGGEIVAGEVVVVKYDGTQFQLVSPGGYTAGTNSIANSQLAQMAANTIKGNNTGSTANAADLTVAQVVALLNAAVTNAVNAFTKSQGGPVGTLTDAASIAWDVSAKQKAIVTLGGNRTLAAPTNMADGQTYILFVKQDGTGSRTLAYNAVFKFPNGNAPVLSTAINALDMLCFVSDGTNMYGIPNYGFA